MQDTRLWTPESVEMTLKQAEYLTTQTVNIAPKSKIASIFVELNKGLNSAFAPKDVGGNGQSIPQASVEAEKAKAIPWLIAAGVAAIGFYTMTK